MNARILVTGLSVFIFLNLFFSKDAISQNSDLNFSISTNNLYFPGDDIVLNFYSYDYSDKKKQNLDFRFEVLKIRDVYSFYSKQTSSYSIDVLSRDSMNLLSLTDEVYSFKKNLKAKKEGNYLYINETIDLKIKSKGAYIVKVTSGNKVAYCGFVVSSLGIVSKAGNNTMLAFVVDRKSGQPINGAELGFFLGMNKIGSGKTNDGVYYQQIINNQKNNSDENLNPMIIGQYNDDVIISDSYFYFGFSSNKYYTYLYTEQPVYRTNSEVNFKGTIRINNLSKLDPLSYKDLTVIINDSKGTEVYKQNLKTNEMGSFDGKFFIDENAPLGNYTIFANIDENYSYSANFSVEQYKKPEYKVTVTAGKGQYFDKDNLEAEIEAKYFFGNAVTDADVEYNIYKMKYYKPWWKFSEYAWWYEDYYNNMDANQEFRGSELIYSGNGKLNNDGKLDINYLINEDFKSQNNNEWDRYYYEENYDCKYIIQAKVTDKSRREISGTTTTLVTRGGFYLNAKCDKYLYKPNETVIIEIIANDFSDKPVQTEFEVNINRTSWSQNDYKEKKDFIKTIKGKTLSNGKGVISFQLDNSEAEGYYTAEVKATDDRSNLITASTHFYVTEGNMWWYNNESGGIQIITDKESYKIGDVCKAMIILTNPDANVLITTNTDDIITYQVNKFTGKSEMIDIPVTDKYLSNFEINVNYVYDGVFYNSSKPVLIIPEDKFLTVQIEPSKLIYKPKDEGELKVKVTDQFGNPVRNAEVSIGIVDESIYSIEEDKTTDIRKFFYGNRSVTVSTSFSNSNNSYGNSRLITIYEKFNLASLSDKDLATVTGRLLNKKDEPISNAIIVIDEDFMAATSDYDGNFEFKLPAGEYSVSVYSKGKTKDDLLELSLKKGQIKTIRLYNDRELNEEQNGLTEIKPAELGADEMSIKGGRTDDGKAYKDLDRQSARVEKKKDVFQSFDDEADFQEATVRSDFRDAILWSPYTVTDENGYATVDVKYPDNLTEWRITSRVITEDTKVGQMVSTVITRKDLLIRMETPRFLQENDEVTISTIIHNYLDTEKKTKIKFSGENVNLINSSDEETISIAPGADVRVDWKIKITEPIGEAKLYAEALTNEESDAMEVKIPLQARGLKKDIIAVTDFTDGFEYKTETKNIFIPDGTDIRSSVMNISVDPSVASTILTSLDDLAGYPYGCVEQTMSRFLPTVVVVNAFNELNVPLNEKTKTELPLMVNKGLQRLYSLQHSDGGWGWWENDASNPYMSAYVIYGLSIAKENKYEVNENILKRGINSVKSQLNNEDIDATSKVYMLYALSTAKSLDKDLLNLTLKKIKSSDINDYARSLLALTYKNAGENEKAEEMVNELEKNVKLIGEGAAYWEGKEFHYRWQDDKVQTTAMALKAINAVKNNSDLKSKIVRWLMMQRMGTSWRNTQETAIVVYSIVDYLKNSNELEPDYTATISVNGKIVLQKIITKQDVFKKSKFVEIEAGILKPGQNEIKIEKSGNGKLYFSSNTTYYESSDKITPKENGMRVEREYFKLEKYDSFTDDKITYRKKYFDGNLKSGDDILVKVKVYSKEDNQYFMLEDPLPSGFEVIKDDWSFTIEDENNYAGYSYYYWRWWYADKEVRDDKITFFATYIGKGEYEFSYLMHAQIPGEYTSNPSKGMLMYYPEYNGSSESIKLNITD